MFLMTGSLLVPIKAIIMNVLSLGATFGVLTAVFQGGWWSNTLNTLTVGGLSPYLLVTVFAFAFAFSMDYEVFLLGRIQEYVNAGHDTDDAVRLWTSLHLESASRFGDHGPSTSPESPTGQALSLIYTPTTPPDLEASGLEPCLRTKRHERRIVVAQQQAPQGAPKAALRYTVRKPLPDRLTGMLSTRRIELRPDEQT